MNASQPYRRPEGGRIDRSRLLRFTFNSKPYEGYAGDTLASALLANGVRVVGRSFKFHRPRGILSAGVEEPNALVRAGCGSGMLPNVRATLMPLLDGLSAESQNCFPSVNFDIGRMLDFTRPLWAAGFYNKTFKYPNWHAFEWAIRRLSGLGRLPGGVDPARYRHENVHCDLLVVGAGPAGLAAARRAAHRGDDVVLAEQDTEPGGSLLYDAMAIDGEPSDDWLAAAVSELGKMENVRLLLGATVAGYYDHNVLTIHDCSDAYRATTPLQTLWKVRARRVLLATGAIEQPLVFGNNDLPGVMLAGAIHQYAGRFGVHCGRRVVGVVNNDLAWHSILAICDSGMEVPAIVDTRSTVSEELLASAAHRDTVVHTGATSLCARGSAAVRALAFSVAGSRASHVVECDAIAMSGGLSPNVHLYSQAGGSLRYDDSLACFVPHECGQQVEVLGAANGRFSADGTYNIRSRRPASAPANAQWIDLLSDVTALDIELAVRENYSSVELLKRYTTTGMAADQGKTSNLNALSVLAELSDRSPGDVGTTTFRPMFMPITMAAIAGSRSGYFFTPFRRLPAHPWHEKRGAVFDDYGEWTRPAFYGEDRNSCVEREVLQVRHCVGLFDASPLGKIEVRGPDAARFLDYLYANTVATLRPGRVRYGVMLDENGVVMDDGVFARLAEDHFLLNTTSGNAEKVAAWLEEWRQCHFGHLRVVTSNVTSQWAVATVAGPKAQPILKTLLGDAAVACPHMGIVPGVFEDGSAYRLQRVSFSGEQSYEISVPANRLVTILDRLMAIGAPYGLKPFGVESLIVLRIEKAFMHVGVDTDGTTSGLDVGFGKAIAQKNTDFIGALSLKRREDKRRDRRQLISFELDTDSKTVTAGAHFIGSGKAKRRSEGFVTSACRSPTLGKAIGLGLLERGIERTGERIRIYDNGKVVTGRIINAPFYDPSGDRMRA